MIGEKVIEKVKLLSDELIGMHGGRIQKAFAKQEDGKLTVSLSFVIQPSDKAGMIDVDATISYTMEKVKEKITAKVSENQVELPLIKAVDRLRPKAGSGIDSVTLSSGGQSVTLTPKEA